MAHSKQDDIIPTHQNKRDDIGGIEQVEKDAMVHLEHIDGLTTNKGWLQIRSDAIAAETREHDLTLKQAFKAYRKAIAWVFLVSLCIIMESYDMALLASLFGSPPFRRKYGVKVPGKDDYQLEPKRVDSHASIEWQTATQQGVTVGHVLGIFVASEFQRRFGYVRTIQGSLILITSFIFIVFFAPNIRILFVGEFLCGFPFGAFSSSVVAYASEITPVRLRGYLTTYINMCWVIGQFISSGVLVGVQARTDQWAYKIPFAIQWVWPLPLFIIVSFAPESPWWLVRKGRLEAAEKNVKRLSKSGENVDSRFTVAMMVRTNQHEIDNAPGVNVWDCFKGSDLRRTEISCMAWGMQVLCGSAFANQGPYFFQQAGLATADSFKVTLGQRGLAFIGVLMSWFWMTRYGRRRIYLVGVAFLAFCAISFDRLLIIGVLAIPSAHGNPGAKWGQTVMILLWIFTYDNSIAPLAYCVVGETSSTRLRVQTVGLARNFYNTCNIVGGIVNNYALSPLAWNWKGYEGFLWFGIAAICWVWAYFRLPEMKGRTFRELDILFERRIPARKFRPTIVTEEDEH